MRIGNRLLAPLLLACTVLLAASALRPAPALGRAGPAPPCDVPVETDGGVRCLGRADAARRGLRAGDGMPAARWAGWNVPVPVNGASLDQLASLDGIGPALARRIAAARPFRTLDDVGRVRGVGPRRLARLRPRLVLDEP